MSIIVTPQPLGEYRQLLKFLIMSSLALCIGTIQGVLQVVHPIRVWLDSIGSPYGGPGHMIDPLAHAHINVVGGVVLLVMGATYYLMPVISGRPIWSRRLVDHTFWWITLGVSGFYTTLMFFGITEGRMQLQGLDTSVVHHYYGIAIAVVSSVMGVGFWLYFVNVFMSAREIYKTRT